ncbi:MAG: HAD family hydrolase [Anaerolineae bacterium]
MGGRDAVALDREMIDAVLFDLDGTLMDTDDQIVESLSLWGRRLGWPALDRGARRIVMAAETPVNGLVSVLDAVGLDGPLLGLRQRFRRWRGASARRDYRLMDGARLMLAQLKQCYQLGVVTTRGRDDALAFLAQHDLVGVFDVVVTRQCTGRLKPHPEPILCAANRLGLPVGRCVMVGDTTTDVRSARRAGAKAVAVCCGFGERGELERAGADVVLEGLSDLLSLL